MQRIGGATVVSADAGSLPEIGPRGNTRWLRVGRFADRCHRGAGAVCACRAAPGCNAVMDSAQVRLEAPGTGFKGFIPAVFARLVSEQFARRAGGRAVIKVTAPPALVRNRAARPDAFEAQIIAAKFLAPDWPRGAAYAATEPLGPGAVFRVMVPEYDTASCLACHGGPKGSLDVTGYPREGAQEGDLGGVISITLLR